MRSDGRSDRAGSSPTIAIRASPAAQLQTSEHRDVADAIARRRAPDHAKRLCAARPLPRRCRRIAERRRAPVQRGPHRPCCNTRPPNVYQHRYGAWPCVLRVAVETLTVFVAVFARNVAPQGSACATMDLTDFLKELQVVLDDVVANPTDLVPAYLHSDLKQAWPDARASLDELISALAQPSAAVEGQLQSSGLRGAAFQLKVASFQRYLSLFRRKRRPRWLEETPQLGRHHSRLAGRDHPRRRRSQGVQGGGRAGRR